jgi:hypothetical protein
MLTGAIVGVSLLVTVAADSGVPLGTDTAGITLSLQQKNAVLRPLVSSATDCIIGHVTNNPGVRESVSSDTLGDLIVASMKPCLITVRAMIDTYDRLFGHGSGEAFFMGPYLDLLPRVIVRRMNDAH